MHFANQIFTDVIAAEALPVPQFRETSQQAMVGRLALAQLCCRQLLDSLQNVLCFTAGGACSIQLPLVQRISKLLKELVQLGFEICCRVNVCLQMLFCLGVILVEMSLHVGIGLRSLCPPAGFNGLYAGCCQLSVICGEALHIRNDGVLICMLLAVLINLPAAQCKFLLRFIEALLERRADGVKLLFKLQPAVAQHPFSSLDFIQIQ